MLKQCLTFLSSPCYLEFNMGTWGCRAKETMDRTETWITNSVQTNLTITVFSFIMHATCFGFMTLTRSSLWNFYRWRLKLQTFTNVVSFSTFHGVVAKALRYKSESRGSNPDSFVGIFQLYNPSGCTMALGSTHRLTEMSTKYNYVGKGGRSVRVITFLRWLSWNLGPHTFFNPRPVQGLLSLYLYTYYDHHHHYYL